MSQAETVREIVRRRDGASKADIDGMFEAFAEDIEDGLDPEEALAQNFGLEPDYLLDEEVWAAIEGSLKD